ncbi:peroxisomal catalase [Penicillium macrosclerotiorum]|uniref:peroxisomal catalase n=1 Tax=Penicillium macrosclerotiorum TaxID=303699 RepID=UPI002547457D|nr:peroxisomal catalase [Penicillium macrosclerotiorum]KAJ5678581.1 peroxisomal catalase [Penicillium macrosclerotiorum]
MSVATASTGLHPTGCPVMAHRSAPLNNEKYPEGRESQIFESLSRFNREKIVERPVHAKGAGAYGVFEVTHDISDVCEIDALLGVGKKIPCVTRFSTTGLERGSADGARDLKGMATKLFTKDGEWDWVGLNFPLFFIRDPAKFPDLMHAQRRDPQNNLLNPNMLWEFLTENHEALHMSLIQFSDFGTMFSWRNLSAYTGHAFKWVKADGSFKYVHLFLSSDKGPNLETGEQAFSSETDPDQATKDLFEAIERGDNPTWTVNIQVIDPKDAPRLDFNILDVTKHWNLGNYPDSIPVIPSRPVGKLTLNRNPQNYFSEVEQLAFSPSHLVPGIEPSEDPVLQARMFAYPDAQRYRLGHHHSAPNQITKTQTYTESLGPEFAEWLAKTTSKSWSQPNPDDYKFPGNFYDRLPVLRDQKFQDRMVENVVESVSMTRDDVRQRVYHTLGLVHPELAQRVRDGAEALVHKQSSSTPRGDAGSLRL